MESCDGHVTDRTNKACYCLIRSRHCVLEVGHLIITSLSSFNHPVNDIIENVDFFSQVYAISLTNMANNNHLVC